MDTAEKQFTAGFNNGYLIARYKPELFRKLRLSLTASNEYVHGLLSGGRQYSIEVEISRNLDLQKIRKTKSREGGLERD